MVDRSDIYISQAQDFYRETYYIPTSYDAQFHTDFFASTTTIRRNFGSWENYIDEAFPEMRFESMNRMFYAGFGQSIRPDLSDEMPPSIIMLDGRFYDILWDASDYSKKMSDKQIWVMKNRVESVYDAVVDACEKVRLSRHLIEIIPADRKHLFPAVKVDDIVFATLDTPVIKNHYKRCVSFVASYEGNDDTVLSNLNGVKANHLEKRIREDLIDL